MKFYVKTCKYLFVVLFILFFLSSLAEGKIYRWVDGKGTIGFTDNPSNLPEKYRETVTVYDETEPGERPTIIEETKPPQPDEESETRSDVDDNGHDEGWWKNRVRELKTRREVLIEEKARLEEEYNTTYSTWLNPSAPGNKNLDEINKQISSGKPVDKNLFFLLPVPQPEVTKKLEELKKQIAQIDEELQSIEYDLNVGLPEEARRANALPGWLRD